MVDILDSTLLAFALVALTIGSIMDLKRREVPDWLSFSLIAIGIGSRFVCSALTHEWNHISNGVAGFLVFSIWAYLMFYAGLWGGGDSKIIMGIGAVLGLEISNFDTLDSVLLGFFLNVLFVTISISCLIFVMKVLRKNCMRRRLEPVQLTGNDCIVENVKVDGNRIVGPKGLGIENKQTEFSVYYFKQEKAEKPLINGGVPFIPILLIALIITMLCGNWFLRVIL